MWKVGEGKPYIAFIVAQDEKFQMAMRQELRELAKDRGLVLREKPVVTDSPPKRIPRLKMANTDRDFIFVRTNTPSSFGGIWQRAKHEQIIAECGDKYRVSREELIGQGRSRETVKARYEAYHRMSSELGYSLTMIGSVCGGKDHSSVHHGLAKYRKRLAELTMAEAA